MPRKAISRELVLIRFRVSPEGLYWTLEDLLLPVVIGGMVRDDPGKKFNVFREALLNCTIVVECRKNVILDTIGDESREKHFLRIGH